MSGKNRAVRVASVTQDYLRQLPPDEMVGRTLERLDACGRYRPDIACLPELFADSGAEPVPGPMTARISQWAKANGSYAICSMKTAVDGRTYNSAVLIDRAGQVVGQYNKLHPTEGELASGTSPGSEVPVFSTDFGVIGIQICFDVNWRRAWQSLKKRGAEIVFWPSAYPAHRMLSALAWMNEYYVVASTMARGSRIYDISGEVMDKSGVYQQWAQATLHLSKRLFEVDYHMEKMRALQQKYGERVLVQWYHDEDWFTLASLDPDLSVEELIQEFGLLPLQEYHARCERAQQEAAGGVAWRSAMGE
jgi:predicted amidohydrolase